MDVMPSEEKTTLLTEETPNDDPPRQRNVLVLTDFSEKVHAALSYASAYAAKSGGKLLLLHVANPDEEDRSQDLSQLVAEYSEAVECNWLLSQGDFLKEVAAAMRDFHADMVVIGSAHLNTPELYKKSLARKLFKHLPGVYLLVQHSEEVTPFQRILLPVDYTDKPDCQQIWLDRFAGLFQFDVHLVLPQVNESELQEAVELNLERLTTRLQAKSIPYVVYTVAGQDDYSQEILAYASKVKADLLVINSLRDAAQDNRYFMESHERSLILHATTLPVLVVNG